MPEASASREGLRRRPHGAHTLSFKEQQRMNATQMEFFGFAGWLASTFIYGTVLIVCPPAPH